MNTSSLPSDYEERVYAGWLGKCIGVRFGAPLEGWTYDEIRDNVGELISYVHEDKGKIFKPDDDTAVPMIFIRALIDYTVNVSSEQLGNTWLNYMGDQHGALWWGGYGVSTEHTAYVNLANGISAPRSGSIAQNGAAVAEQIGGQIFSDIWGWIAPNNPSLAADYAEKASSVSHDGNGIYGGRFIAALVSAAFSERDPHRLIEIGLAQIPADSEYARVINATVQFYRQSPDDWHAAYQMLKANFGYDRYPGIVHIIPNAGVVALGLLYGSGDFSRTLQITNSCGWDTDCNVGNVGAIIGTTVGTQGIDDRWREPINDLLIASSIIGTNNLLTLPQCADLFTTIGYQLHSEQKASKPRYHFRYPGSTNNFSARGERARPIHLQQSAAENTLKTSIRKLNKKGELRIFTRTYYRPKELSGNFYEACFTPLIYSGQTVEARVRLVEDAPKAIHAALYVYDDNHGVTHQATAQLLIPGEWYTLCYTIPALKDSCLSEVGIVIRNMGEVWETGSFHLESLDWSGTPDYECTFSKEKPETGGISQWTRLRGYWRLEDGAYHGSGIGMCESYSGDNRWTDYTYETTLVPIVGDNHHINVRVQGAQRSYAFGLAPYNQIALYKKDKTYREVANLPFTWVHGESYRLSVTASGNTFTAVATALDGTTQTLHWQDTDQAFLNGQIGLSTWNGGHTRFQSIQIRKV